MISRAQLFLLFAAAGDAATSATSASAATAATAIGPIETGRTLLRRPGMGFTEGVRAERRYESCAVSRLSLSRWLRQGKRFVCMTLGRTTRRMALARG